MTRIVFHQNCTVRSGRAAARGSAGVLLVAAVAAAAAAGPPAGGVTELRIRPRVTLTADRLTLADVLVFAPQDESLRTELGRQPVFADAGGAPATVVTHEQIETRLRELGLEPSRLLLGGARLCRVTVPAAPAADQRPAPESAAPPRAAGAVAGGLSERTLAEVLRERINDELQPLGGQAEVEFDPASRPFLDLTTPPWDFSVRGAGRQQLGLREFHVVLRRDGRTHRTATIFAHVRLSRPVLVAQRPLNVGTLIERDALRLEVRQFDRDQDLGLEAVEHAVGQKLVRFVPAGQMLSRKDLAAVELVRRGRPVVLTRAAGGVRAQLTGVALDSGGCGDLVRVRVGEHRRQQQVLQGIVTGLGTVRLEEKGP